MQNGYIPKVSIIIPVYNGANYMREAINSALAQTYQNIEVIVINDGSNDIGESDRIAKSYGSRICYYVKENGGVSTALNLGIEKMSGDYFSWLSHDDKYPPDKIEKEVRLLQEANDTTIVFSGYTTIDSFGRTIKHCRLPKSIANSIKCLIALDVTYTLNGCTLLIPKKLFELYGKFDPRLRYTQDYDMWLRLVQQDVKFLYLDECLMFSRQHQEQGGRISGPEVTIEADKLHQKAIASLTPNDVKRYINGDISLLEMLYKAYTANSYLSTSIEIIKLIARYLYSFMSTDDAEDFLIDQMGIMKELCSNYKDLVSVTNDVRPKLVFCITGWFCGGIERVLVTLLPHLAKQYQIFIFSAYVKNETGFEIPDSIVKITLDNHHTTPLSIRITTLAHIYNTCVFVGNANPQEPFFPAISLLRTIGIKTIILNHYYYFLPYWNDDLSLAAEARHHAYANSDIVLWLTSFSALICKARHPNTGVMPNPNSFSLKASQREYPEEQIVLAVGRFFDANKRADKIIKVFAGVYQKNQKARLIMVGGYSLDTRFQMSQNKKLSEILGDLSIPKDAISFEGEKSDIHSYYKKASVLLMASEYEGFPMVLTEAGVYGIPSIVFYYPGCNDIILDGVNGFIIPKDNDETAIDKVSILLTEMDLWRKMSKNAYTMSRRFDQAEIVKRWETLLELLLNNEREYIPGKLKELGFMPNDNFLSENYGIIPAEYEHHFWSFITKKANSCKCRDISDESWYSKYLASQNEVEAIKKTISWRCTIPLRLFKKVLSSLKYNGLLITIKKVFGRIFN